MDRKVDFDFESTVFKWVNGGVCQFYDNLSSSFDRKKSDEPKAKGKGKAKAKNVEYFGGNLIWVISIIF